MYIFVPWKEDKEHKRKEPIFLLKEGIEIFLIVIPNIIDKKEIFNKNEERKSLIKSLNGMEDYKIIIVNQSTLINVDNNKKRNSFLSWLSFQVWSIHK